MASVIVSSDNLNVDNEAAVNVDREDGNSETLTILEQTHSDIDEIRTSPEAIVDNSVNLGDSETIDVNTIDAEPSGIENSEDKHTSNVIVADSLNVAVPDAPILQDTLATDANETASDNL